MSTTTPVWRDLVELDSLERAWELGLPLPWLIASWFAYAHGMPVVGAVCSFCFFLCGLRLSHNAQHRCLGIGRGGHDLVLFVLSGLMMMPSHAVRVTHLHHHRTCLAEDDVEASHISLAWWQVILSGWRFPLRIVASAWKLGNARDRRWIALEIGLVAVVAMLGLYSAVAAWHIAAMIVGEWLTAFFAVWIVHRGCDEHTIARSQRGPLAYLSYSMLYHLEHHRYPAVPTVHLAELARRLDALTEPPAPVVGR